MTTEVRKARVSETACHVLNQESAATLIETCARVETESVDSGLAPSAIFRPID